MIEQGLEWIVIDTPIQLAEVSSIPTPGTNRIKVYAKDKAGTSALYYKNDAGVEKDLSGGLTGTGTTNRLAYWSSATVLAANAALSQGHVLFADANGLPSGEANIFWDATNNWLGLGTDAPAFRLDIRGAINADVNIVIKEASADTVSAGLSLLKARGALGSEAPTQNGDVLGAVGFGGWTNAYKFNAARIEAVAGSLWSATNSESYISLGTTPNASLTRAERFRVGSAGQWGIGGATFGTAGDIFKSGGASAAPTWTAPANVTAGSSKITLGGTPTGASLVAFSIDVNQANLDHGSIGGLSDDDHTIYALLAGRSGGQVLKGGTAANDKLSLVATAGVGTGSEMISLFLGNNGASERVRIQGSGIMVASQGATIATPTALIEARTGNGSISCIGLTSTDVNTNGPAFTCVKQQASNNDGIGEFKALFNNSVASAKIGFSMLPQVLDVTDATEDAKCLFAVAQAGSLLFAELSNAGVWTDASTGINKKFEGSPLEIWPDFWTRLKTLQIGRYHNVNTPPRKLAKAERHVSPTAEQLDELFGLAVKGLTPDGQPTMGIAPKDLASLALYGVQQLAGRVEALERQNPAIDRPR